MMTDEERRLRQKVCDAYSAAAESPEGKHPFPVGRRFAESLGYPSNLLDELPSVAWEAFTGVSNVSLFAHLAEGATVLDLGCGAGLDSLIAGRQVGAAGHVISVDFGESMLERARLAVREAAQPNVVIIKAAAENLPLRSGSVDVAIVNGIFNLNPARDSIFQELSRVVRSRGALYAAELILREPLPNHARQSEDDWFA
jgi:arsenite methyltransferase